MEESKEKVGTPKKTSKSGLYWAWAFIVLGGVFDYGYEQVRCVNGFAVECSGVDFTNLIFGAISGVILFSSWSSIVAGDDDKKGSKWGARAAVAACIGLFLTAFDGIGCRCW